MSKDVGPQGRVSLAWDALRGKQSRATLRDEDGWLFDSLVGGLNASGQSVTPKSALALTAYWACIRNISDDISKMPIRMVRETKTGAFEPVLNHPVTELVSVSPNPLMSPKKFWGTMLAHKLGWKGGFAEIVRNQVGEPVELWPIDPTTVTVLWDAKNKTLIYEVRADSGFIKLRSEDVFHLIGLGFDGFTQWAMAEVGNLAIGSGLANQEFGAAYFGNGATLKGVLEAPPTLTDKGMKLLRDTFNMRHAGASNAYKAAILPDGVQYKEISSNPKDSQLIPAAHLSIENMLRLFRMPANKVQHDVRSTFNNIYEINQSYAKDTLQPHGVDICQEGRLKLLSKKDRGLCFRHDFSELLEANPVEQWDVMTKQFSMGMWTPNELMKKANRKPGGEEGERRFVMSNLVPLDKLNEEPAPMPDEPTQVEVDAPEEELDDDAAVKAVTRLFRHDFRRFATTEEDKAMRAMSDRKFKAWAKSFYPKHEKFVAQTLRTRFAVLLGILGVDDSVYFLSDRMAKDYVKESRARIESGSRNEDIDNIDRFAGIMAVRAVGLVQTEEVAV